MSTNEWVKVPVGNWVRFDPLTDEDMAAVVKRLDADYFPADLAGRYAAAWLDGARLISTFAAVQSLVAMQETAPERSAGAAPIPSADGSWSALEVIENAYSHSTDADSMIRVLRQYNYEIRPAGRVPDGEDR